MINTIVLAAALFSHPGDSLKKFTDRLALSYEITMALPPNIFQKDSCYYYSALLKVDINKSSEVTLIQISDNAADWLKTDVQDHWKRGFYKLKELNKAALNAGLKNCQVIIPIEIQAETFPCGTAPKTRHLDPGYFLFDGKPLKGNILFGEEITIPITNRIVS